MLADYLAVPAVHAVGGSWLVSADLLAAHDFDQIAQLAAQAVEVVRATRRGERRMTLTVRAAEDCRYDAVALGEVMLRLDPGEDRIRTAREFRVWEGGGEYNVARGLRRCFGLRTAVVTALADNDVGHLVEDLMLQGGVDTAFVRWVPYDGIGRTRTQRLELHRTWVRRPRGSGRLRPRSHCGQPASTKATSTGTASSVTSACAGCTPGASSPGCPRPRRTSSSRRCRRRAVTARSSPTT